MNAGVTRGVWVDGSYGRPVSGRHSADTDALAGSIRLVNLESGDITVIQKIAGLAHPSAAILNRVLMAVELDGCVRGVDACRQSKVIAVSAPETRDLPTS